MAVVYRARDEVLGRLVAVKVIAPSMADDEEFRARFLRESRAAAAVRSLHILPVYGAGEEGGQLYLAMQLAAGGDLAGLLRRCGGRLDAERAVSLISQVASALDAAHAAGLVHRDVKPGNILLDSVPERSEHAYLTDFGLSRGTATTSLTAPGQFMGTPDYCAPEQARGDRVDGRADQYALGCVAFEMLTGEAPFHRSGRMAALFAHAHDPVPPVTGLTPELAAGVDAVMARVLAKSPEARYATCGEFAAALGEALLPVQRPAALAGASARPFSAVPDFVSRLPWTQPPAHSTVPPAAARQGRTRGLVAAGAAIALVAVVALVLWQTQQGSAQPSAASTQTNRPAATGAATTRPATSAAATTRPATTEPAATGSATTRPATGGPGSPSAGTSALPPNTSRWSTLPPAPSLGKLAFASDFSSPAAGWPASSTSLAVNSYTGGGYVLHPLDRTTYDRVAAPSDVMTSVETVTATASLQDGQGYWGLWCRGTDRGATQSYQFWISHTASVAIDTPQGQTAWVALQGVDVSTPTTLTARCADESPGPVVLTLSVNGRQVVSDRVSSGTLLGPGYSGIEAAGFRDVEGPVAQVNFSRYAIYTG